MTHMKLNADNFTIHKLKYSIRIQYMNLITDTNMIHELT